MNYFRCGGSEKVTIDGEKVKDKLELRSNMFNGVQVGVFPTGPQSLVVYNGELHALGGKKHYKWDGTTWTQLSEIPSTVTSSPVVYNNEIHLIGGNDDYNHGTSVHYKWNGTTWTKLANFPRPNIYSCATVVYNNELHALNGYYRSSSDGYPEKWHYKWDGTTWTKLDYPSFYNGIAVVYNNEIHMIGCGSTSGASDRHYKWDGTKWTYIDDLPYIPKIESAFVYNNEIHIIGGRSSDNIGTHYKWDGTTWEKLSDLPHYSASAVVYNKKIHISGSGTGNGTKHTVLTVPFYTPLPYNVVDVYFTPST